MYDEQPHYLGIFLKVAIRCYRDRRNFRQEWARARADWASGKTQKKIQKAYSFARLCAFIVAGFWGLMLVAWVLQALGIMH
jgi:hypothetical protein